MGFLTTLWALKWFRSVVRTGVCLIILAGVLFGLYHFGYVRGEDNQKAVYAAQQAKIEQAVKKQTAIKQTAVNNTITKAEQTQIVYRDRIVTKYVPVEKEVVKYVEKENSNPVAAIHLGVEWVRLHNSAAQAGNQSETTGSAAVPDGQASPAPNSVTSGEALQTITANYKQYAECVQEVEGWQNWYKDLQAQYNK